MTYEVWQGFAQNDAGDVLDTATVTVTLAGTTTKPALFSDEDGTGSKTNPFTTDASGFVQFYTAPAIVDIVATKGAFSVTFSNVRIGLPDALQTVATLAELQGAVTSSFIGGERKDRSESVALDGLQANYIFRAGDQSTAVAAKVGNNWVVPNDRAGDGSTGAWQAQSEQFFDPVAPAFLKTTSDIINGLTVSILRNLPKNQHSAIIDGSSTYNAGPELNSLISATRATGRGEIVAPRGGKIHTSETILIPRGLKFGSEGYFNVRNRSVKQYGLFNIHAAATLAGDVVALESDHEGAIVQGLALYCGLQISGDGLSLNGSGGTTRYRSNAVVRQIYVEGAKRYGIRFNQGIGGCRLMDSYAYTSVSDNISATTDVSDIMLERVFGSDSVGGSGLNSAFDSSRISNCDFWENASHGAVVQGGNNDFYRLQVDLNGKNGVRLLAAGNQKRNNFVSLTTLDNSRSLSNGFSEIEIASTVQSAKFIGGNVGSYPASGGAAAGQAKYGVEYLGSTDRAIQILGVGFPVEVFRSGVFNGAAARWCKIRDCFDVGDNNRGGDLSIPTIKENIVVNPDLQDAASNWVNTASITITNPTGATIGAVGNLKPTTSDTTQNLDQVLFQAEEYRGRKVIVSFCYTNSAANVEDKKVILRANGGSQDEITLIAASGTYYGLLTYTIQPADTGDVTVRIQPKIAGQGAHQEEIRVGNITCIVI